MGFTGNSERLTLDPYEVESGVLDSTQSPLDLQVGLAEFGLDLVEANYPIGELATTFSETQSMEGPSVLKRKSGTRTISLKLIAHEPAGLLQATNYIPNPSFELQNAATPTSWTGIAGSESVLAQISMSGQQYSAVFGDGVCRVITSGASQGLRCNSIATGISNSVWSTGARVRGNSGGETVALRLYDGATPTTGANVTLTTDWKWLTFTSPAALSSASIAMGVVGTGAATFYVDGAVLGSTTYFDGDMPGCSWTGTPHASTSVRAGSGSGRLAGILNDIGNKIAKLREAGGQLRRRLPWGEILYYKVLDANVSYNIDNPRAHMQGLQPIDLELICEPAALGVAYDIPMSPAATSAGDQVYVGTTTLPIKGDLKALGDLRVQNTSGTSRQLIVGAQMDTFSTAGTAAIMYDAANLTPEPGAEKWPGPSGATGAGANKVIRHNFARGPYVGILTTLISAGADSGKDLTHVGEWAVYARVWGAGPTPLIWEWATGDLKNAVRNAPVQIRPTPTSDLLTNAEYSAESWHVVLLGTMRLPRAAIGTSRWRGRLLAHYPMANHLGGATSGVNTGIHCDWVMFIPVGEVSGTLRGIMGADWPSPAYWDALYSATTQALTAHNPNWPGSTTWTTAEVGGSGSTNFSSAASTPPHVPSDEVDRGFGRNGDPAFPGVIRIARLSGGSGLSNPLSEVEVKFLGGVNGTPGLIGKSTSLASATSWVAAIIVPLSGGQTVTSCEAACSVQFPQGAVGGNFFTGNYRPAKTFTVTVNVWYTIRMLVTALGTVTVWIFRSGEAPGDPLVDNVYMGGVGTGAVSGIGAGTPGLYDSSAVSTVAHRFRNLRAVEAPVEYALSTTSTTAVRHDGVYSLDAGATTWESRRGAWQGDNLLLPASGRQNRALRVAIRCNDDDFPAGADPNGMDGMNVTLRVRPRYLMAPEEP